MCMMLITSTMVDVLFGNRGMMAFFCIHELFSKKEHF